MQTHWAKEQDGDKEGIKLNVSEQGVNMPVFIAILKINKLFQYISHFGPNLSLHSLCLRKTGKFFIVKLKICGLWIASLVLAANLGPCSTEVFPKELWVLNSWVVPQLVTWVWEKQQKKNPKTLQVFRKIMINYGDVNNFVTSFDFL